MNATNAAFVPEILRQVECILCDFQQHKKKYGLGIRPTSLEVEALNGDVSTLSKLGPRPGASIMRADEFIFKKRKTPWKRLKWISLDDKKIERLFADTRVYSERLERF
jgi:Prion-inhibition and propagation